MAFRMTSMLAHFAAFKFRSMNHLCQGDRFPFLYCWNFWSCHARSSFTESAQAAAATTSALRRPSMVFCQH